MDSKQRKKQKVAATTGDNISTTAKAVSRQASAAPHSGSALTGARGLKVTPAVTQNTGASIRNKSANGSGAQKENKDTLGFTDKPQREWERSILDHGVAQVYSAVCVLLDTIQMVEQKINDGNGQVFRTKQIKSEVSAMQFVFGDNITNTVIAGSDRWVELLARCATIMCIGCNDLRKTIDRIIGDGKPLCRKSICGLVDDCIATRIRDAIKLHRLRAYTNIDEIDLDAFAQNVGLQRARVDTENIEAKRTRASDSRVSASSNNPGIFSR